MLNPYLDEAQEYLDNFNTIDKRYELVRKYSWAIPTEDVINTLAQIAPRIVEVGAGTGYWSWMLAQAGVDVVAYDRAPYENNWAGNNWFPIQKGGASKVARHPDRALLLCWPPYATPFAYWALKCYRGDTLIYIGENVGGCTGDDLFHAALSYDYGDDNEKLKYPVRNEWELHTSLYIPQWCGIHDSVEVYKRKGVEK